MFEFWGSRVVGLFWIYTSRDLGLLFLKAAGFRAWGFQNFHALGS